MQKDKKFSCIVVTCLANSLLLQFNSIIMCNPSAEKFNETESSKDQIVLPCAVEQLSLFPQPQQEYWSAGHVASISGQEKEVSPNPYIRQGYNQDPQHFQLRNPARFDLGGIEREHLRRFTPAVAKGLVHGGRGRLGRHGIAIPKSSFCDCSRQVPSSCSSVERRYSGKRNATICQSSPNRKAV